jgi:hypothetical protein
MRCHVMDLKPSTLADSSPESITCINFITTVSKLQCQIGNMRKIHRLVAFSTKHRTHRVNMSVTTTMIKIRSNKPHKQIQPSQPSEVVIHAQSVHHTASTPASATAAKGDPQCKSSPGILRDGSSLGIHH